MKGGGPATPLAERLRPGVLEELVGQDHLLGEETPLGRMLAREKISSIILWGPPGTGKTTLARLLARAVGQPLAQLSAVMSGVADLRKVYDEAKRRRHTGQPTLLFIDEIHRFNRAQQDGLLAQVEDGTVILIGATTENPSFALTGALLSRCQVLVLNRLDQAALLGLIERAEKAIGHELPLTDDTRSRLTELADGDGRYLLNMVESLADLSTESTLDPEGLAAVLQRRMPLYDKQQEAHYNLISALHKSVRGSDPDAALYWFARMIDGGEDPRYLARRIVRMASEDIGAADPTALPLTLAAAEAYERLGTPEGELALAQAVVHLAMAPKSNAVYVAFKRAMAAARESGSLGPPAHILNAPTRLMKDLGYGKGYDYDHDAPDRFSGQNYFPDGMERQPFYQPIGEGAEAEVKERLERWSALRAQRHAAEKKGGKA
ncbi:MAG: replication-associated recombination protein A [Alphaproteobacteria bacterium]|nr:replication-associated recombination protein A [Alphaproteobacteria bacterium]